MRALVLAFVVVCAAVLMGNAATAAANPAPPVPSASAAAPAPMIVTGVRRFNESYRSHRHQFVGVSDYSERARHNWMVGLFAFAVFVLLTVPKNTRGVRAFYRQMMERAPLPEGDGVTDDDNRQARAVLFFYLLFLLYQLVQFPLTLGHDRGVPFYADLIVQTGLLVAVTWTFHRLKRGLSRRWRGDPARRDKMDGWLNARLQGINIRWRDIRKLALGVFVGGFAPAALSHLTGWLDALTDMGQRMVGP